MALETRLLTALSETRVASVETGALTLFSADGRALATFAPDAP
jgi:hypothetical protein